MDNANNNLRVLMEMRHGVLSTLPDLELSGLLQISKRSVRGGVYGRVSLSEAERVHRFARVVVSLKGRNTLDWKGDIVVPSRVYRNLGYFGLACRLERL